MRRKRVVLLALPVLLAALSAAGGARAGEGTRASYQIDPALLNRRASATAPLDPDHRRVGFVSVEPPGEGAQPVVVEGNGYLYARGVFWTQRGGVYVVAAAPVGALVDALPAGAEKLPGGRKTIYYWFGTFFGEKEGKYEVVRPPYGTAVGYIPEPYLQGWAETSVVYRYEATCFWPVLVRGRLMYEVNYCE